MNKFGDLIRQNRENQELLLRQLAAKMDMDTAQLSKIERGERVARKDHIAQFAKLLTIPEQELLTLWLSDQIHALVDSEEVALDALKHTINDLKTNL